MLKTEIRKVYKKRRQDLSTKERLDCSSQIADIVVDKFSLEMKTVSIFLPIERLNELDTTFLINKLETANCKISVPVSDFKSLKLKHVIYNSESKLKNNEWGIPEPVGGECILPTEIDIVFVPLLITDEKGFRVGYGKGFYDRFLSKCSKNTVFVGLNYFDEFVEVENLNAEDVPLHYLVTPTKVQRFGK